MPVQVNIKGLQVLAAANLDAIRALKLKGALGKAIQEGTARVHRLSIHKAPVDTGALRASVRMKIDNRQVMGRVIIDRTARNPRTKMRTAEYAYYLHQRGQVSGRAAGTILAFFEYVYEKFGDRILARMADTIKRALP